MKDKFYNSNINNVSGNIFNASTTIISGNNNFKEYEIENLTASYTPDPIWKSPIIIGILTWIGFFISLIEFFSNYKIFNFYLDENKIIIYLVVFVIGLFSLFIIIFLINMVKKETRYPLFFNYAISGLVKKITIKKFIL